MFQKDSLEMTDDDRARLRQFIADDDASHYVITHGTDTMACTADALAGLAGKAIVLTGALSPARFRTSDAAFNIGMAVAAVQVVRPGVYIAMSGQVFNAGEARKNRAENRFERIAGDAPAE
jgi:L-asparaginase